MTEATPNSVLSGYVETLVEHARAALWPERRAALEAVRRGIAKCTPGEHEAAVRALGLDLPKGLAPAEAVFRVVLTAYLARLGESEITNHDQALLYGLSLDQVHADLAAKWFGAHPDFSGQSG